MKPSVFSNVIVLFAFSRSPVECIAFGCTPLKIGGIAASADHL